MSVLAPGRNIVLIGLMGSGKTTVGRIVAHRLDRPFVDTDELVEAEAGRSIAQIFAVEGERGFRAREAAAVRRVAALRGQVIAVGGGAVLDADNVTQLRGTGDMVLLDAPATTLAARIGDTATRPLLDAADAVERLEALRVARDAAYAGTGAHTVDTEHRSAAEVADEVLVWARQTPGLLSREELA